MSRSVVRIGRRGKGIELAVEAGREGREANLLELDTRVELIQALIPTGLEAVNEVLQQEVYRLVGEPERQCGGTNDDTEPIGISTRKGIDPRAAPVRKWSDLPAENRSLL